VDFLARTERNPFDMDPPCDRYVPGYGDTTADFHVVGDSPRVHGGLSTGIPFTDRPWSAAFFDALLRADLLAAVDVETGHLACADTFLSYLYMCDPGADDPEADSYARMESYFDAELRAVTAHVLLPVGARATRHVLANYTAKPADTARDMDALHGVELHGSGWLVLPIKSPEEWSGRDADRLVEGLTRLRHTDYRQLSDLGRFLPGEDPYVVR